MREFFTFVSDFLQKSEKRSLGVMMLLLACGMGTGWLWTSDGEVNRHLALLTILLMLGATGMILSRANPK